MASGDRRKHLLAWRGKDQTQQGPGLVHVRHAGDAKRLGKRLIGRVLETTADRQADILAGGRRRVTEAVQNGAGRSLEFPGRYGRGIMA